MSREGSGLGAGWLGALWALAVSCGGGGEAGVVVGVTTELRPGVDFLELDVRIEAGGEVLRDETLDAASTSFPLELVASDLDDGDSFAVSLRARAGSTTVVERSAETIAIEGRTLLLPTPLQRVCSGLARPLCDEGQTCQGGVCVSVSVDPGELSDYSPNWAGNQGDACAGEGPPELIFGLGQATFAPLEDGAVVAVESGPQGGNHVWLAARTKNLSQYGSITVARGRIEALDYDIPATSVIYPLQRDEGGYCRVVGVRFQVDGAYDVSSLDGETVDLTLEVQDPRGVVGTGQRSIVLETSNASSGP